MNEQQYLTERLDDQLNWYSDKSQWNQRWYKRLKKIEIACAALIPFCSGLGNEFGLIITIPTGVLGVSVAICMAVMSTHKYHENWIQYRITAEQLKHEKFLYLTQASPYNSINRFETLVLRVENLISGENSNWSQVMSLPNGRSTQEQSSE